MNKIYVNRNRSMVRKIIMTDKSGAVSFVELTPLKKVTLNIPDDVTVKLQQDITEVSVVVPANVKTSSQTNNQQQTTQKKESTSNKGEVKDGNI